MCWKNIANICKTKTTIEATDFGKIQQNTTLYLCFMQKTKNKNQNKTKQKKHRYRTTYFSIYMFC